MFYIPRNSYYYNPSPSPSRYTTSAPRFEREPRVSPDEFARARYLRALQEQRAARKAYADSIAERELRRLEEEDEANDYLRHSNSMVVDEDDDNYGYVDDWSSALRARQAAVAAEQERRRALAAAAEEERQRALAAAAEEQRRRALAAAEEEQRRKAHAYQQAKAYFDAYNEHQRTKPSHRKLGRVTPDTRPVNLAESTAQPVRIPVRGASPSRQTPTAPTPAPATTPSPVQTSTVATPPSPAESTSSLPPESALAAISTIESKLSTLRSSFSLPPSLDFAAPRELSYSSQNAPIRSYEHQLGGLLEKLDEIESAGVAEIRKERKRVVELVEKVLEEIDTLVKEEWRKAHPEDREEPTEVEMHDAEPTVTEDATTIEPAESSSAPLAEDIPRHAGAATQVDTMDIEDSVPEDSASSSTSSSLVTDGVSSPAPTTAPAPEEPETSTQPESVSDAVEADDSHSDVDAMAYSHSLDPIVEEPMSDNEGASTVHESIVLEPRASSEPSLPSTLQRDAVEPSPAPTEELANTSSEYPPRERIEDYEMVEH